MGHLVCGISAPSATGEIGRSRQECLREFPLVDEGDFPVLDQDTTVGDDYIDVPAAAGGKERLQWASQSDIAEVVDRHRDQVGFLPTASDPMCSVAAWPGRGKFALDTVDFGGGPYGQDGRLQRYLSFRVFWAN
ncbi:hypothetical protein [Nocardia sp. R7R-8]|uniref:hypothetical protein n=1 Tax=Nocardia sp. R7R-8 TaxID=3459304 RepID=UPI00403DC6CE